MTNYEVFDYWKDKKLPNDEWILLDYGEPKCWACGKPIIVETKKALETGDYKKIWNKTQGKLQKCHIIPKALGGRDDADNLFLMCETCHTESPDTIYSEVFFKWIMYKRNHCFLGEDINKLKQIILNVFKIYNITDLEDFLEYIKNKQNIENAVSNINSHGGLYSDYSLIMAIVHEYSIKKNSMTI